MKWVNSDFSSTIEKSISLIMLRYGGKVSVRDQDLTGRTLCKIFGCPLIGLLKFLSGKTDGFFDRRRW